VGQNNEAEALRAWRDALDSIYYLNAFRIPSGWTPRTETEKALQDSLRAMELQCKERVDLLEALRKSRQEAGEEAEAKGGGGGGGGGSTSSTDAPFASRESLVNKSAGNGAGTWLGGDTVPPANYSDLPRWSPAMADRRPLHPSRPSYMSKKGSDTDTPRTMSLQSTNSSRLTPPPLPHAQRARARTPSPEKRSSGMLRTLRANPKDRSSSAKMVTTLRNRAPTAATKAATQVWAGQPTLATGGVVSQANGANNAASSNHPAAWDPFTRTLRDGNAAAPARSSNQRTAIRPPSPSDYFKRRSTSSLDDAKPSRSYPPPYPDYPVPYAHATFARSDESVETAKPSPPPHATPPCRHDPPPPSPAGDKPPKPSVSSLSQQLAPASISYMKEYPNHPPSKPRKPPPPPPKGPGRSAGRASADSDGATPRLAPPKTVQAQPKPPIPRKAVGGRAAGVVRATIERQKLDGHPSSERLTRPDARPDDYHSSSPEPTASKTRSTTAKRRVEGAKKMTPPSSADDEEEESPDADHPATPTERDEWDARVKHILKHLPRGVDEAAARQIFNEVVIHGDEVHWDDVAGLDIAKDALKETVVYPFLRPDLFLGLREPARGMLLFGPPGTGKTMLARAVATESRSVFFAISASSLTSKFLGESEKLVRALFALAKVLSPSIIFVDEIDSLLGARGGGSEHEATRRIKTEFLIQWSDLQKAAAGRATTEGDATRVLVLAATNMPWAIDEAARRRFVRRQYIPLPEPHVREQHLRSLLAAQKHGLDESDLADLVRKTEGFSGSDLTALAKDAAMGPLRSLGERLLDMRPEEIRGIRMEDFERSLGNIRPSVSREGLGEFEKWAGEFGERGG